MRRLIVVLVSLCVVAGVSIAQSSETPIYSVENSNLYADVGDGAQLIPLYRYQDSNGSREFLEAAPDSYEVELYVSDFDASVVLVRVFWDDGTDGLYSVDYKADLDDDYSFSDLTPDDAQFEFHEVWWADLPPIRDLPILFDGQNNFALLSFGGFDPNVPETREDFLYVKVYSYSDLLSPYRGEGQSYTVGQLPWGLAFDGQATDDGAMPALANFEYAPDAITAIVGATTGETLRLTTQQVEQITIDDTTAPVEFTDAPPIADCNSAENDCTPGGILARIGDAAVLTPIQGDVLDSFRRPRDENGRHIFTTREYTSDFSRYDRMYLVDSSPLRVRCLLGCTQRFDGRLNGGVVFPPENRDVIFYVAYTETEIANGASLWRLNITQSTPQPEVIDSELRFWADAGNFAMPQFIDASYDGFVVKTVGRGGSDVRVYSWSGELYGTVDIPAPEFP